MEVLKLLFVCTDQGARAQIAEHYFSRLNVGAISAVSASFEQGVINGLPNRVMEADGHFAPLISPPSIFERFANNESFDLIISICDESGTEQCPIFRDCVRKLYGGTSDIEHWSIRGFDSINGEPDFVIEQAIDIRDQIKAQVKALCARYACLNNAGLTEQRPLI